MLNDSLNTSFLTRELNLLMEDPSFVRMEDPPVPDLISSSQASIVSLGVDLSFETFETETVEKELMFRGANRDYHFCTTYLTHEEAKKVIDNEKIWSSCCE